MDVNFTKRFQKYLDNLPKTMWGLVVLMSSRRIKGYAGRAFSCPISRLIQSDWPEHEVGVGLNSILINEQRFWMPSALGAFARLVDMGKLPAFTLG